MEAPEKQRALDAAYDLPEPISRMALTLAQDKLRALQISGAALDQRCTQTAAFQIAAAALSAGMVTSGRGGSLVPALGAGACVAFVVGAALAFRGVKSGYQHSGGVSVSWWPTGKAARALNEDEARSWIAGVVEDMIYHNCLEDEARATALNRSLWAAIIGGVFVCLAAITQVIPKVSNNHLILGSNARGDSTLLNEFYEYIKDEGGFWGSIIAGCLALLAGWIAYRAGQIQAEATLRASEIQGTREGARLDRLHASARAVLPLALSSLVEYASSCATSLDLLTSVLGLPGPAIYSAPLLDPGAIPTLRDVIESASPVVGKRIATIISEVQVLSDRMRKVAADVSSGGPYGSVALSIPEYILNAATIFARGSALFAYARSETDEPPAPFPTEKELHTALKLIGFDDSTHPVVFSLASRRAEHWAR